MGIYSISWRRIAIRFALLVVLSGSVIANALDISYVSTVNERAERSTIEAIEQILKSQSIEYEIKKIDPEVDRRPIDSRLLLTLGQGAAQSSVDRYSDIPILSLIIPKKTCINLRNRRKGRAVFSCIHLEQPADRLAYFTSRLFPGRVDALFIVGEQTGYRKEVLEQAFKREKIVLRCENADIVHDLRQFRLNLPLSGLLVTSPDPTAYSSTTLQGIILNAYQANVPILGFSDPFTRAGAAASLFTTTEQLGQQAAQWVIGWQGGDNRTSQVLEPKDFEITINKTIMRTMSIPVPDLEQLKRRYLEDH